jgi:hypothetical protein
MIVLSPKSYGSILLSRMMTSAPLLPMVLSWLVNGLSILMPPDILKFKVDENLPEVAAKMLREAGYDAETVLSEGLGGSLM